MKKFVSTLIPGQLSVKSLVNKAMLIIGSVAALVAYEIGGILSRLFK